MIDLWGKRVGAIDNFISLKDAFDFIMDDISLSITRLSNERQMIQNKKKTFGRISGKV